MKNLTKICYFSGTGNTLWSAKKIAALIGGECDLVNIGMEAQKDTITIEADAVVLLFPAYAYGAPLAVRKFLEKAAIKTPYFAAFVTYGTSPGGALAEVARLVRRKEIGVVYFGRIPAVENYIAIFGPQKPKTIERRLGMQTSTTEEAARCVRERRTNRINTFRPLSAFVSLLFSLGVKIFYKWYTVSDKCNGCDICEKVCPVKAITMKDGRPVFSNKCEHCQGCLNWCPQKAIQFVRLKSDTPRYHHPEIKEADIFR
ncbi:MAG: EFR1 family ferrodoxin [Treponema sp.]|nr:EFR1 family ferrodoxin [Treponema sp.]